VHLLVNRNFDVIMAHGTAIKKVFLRKVSELHSGPKMLVTEFK